jgi:4'-phosphopantetheinyl transferase EntD
MTLADRSASGPGDQQGLEQLLRHLFVAPVAVVVARPEMYLAELPTAEASCVAHAVLDRRREFAAGRGCAREGLAQLGFRADAIAQRPDRTPDWPAGLVGSITHCPGFCGAAVAVQAEASSLGFDAEVAQPMDADLVEYICSREELASFERLPASGPPWATLAFSAKEAFHKAYYPLARRILNFNDALVRFQVAGGGCYGAFETVLTHPAAPFFGQGALFTGRWRYSEGRVYTAVTCRDSRGATT